MPFPLPPPPQELRVESPGQNTTPKNDPRFDGLFGGGLVFVFAKNGRKKKKKRIHLGFFASRSGLKTKDHIEMMRSCNLSWKMGAGTIGIDGVPINGPL